MGDTTLPNAAHSGPNHPPEATLSEQLDADSQTHEVFLLASQMTDQLMRFNGCCADCHEHAQSNHKETVELAAYLDSTFGLCPDEGDEAAQSWRCLVGRAVRWP